ncbi:MAG TPA: clostripain-related cysteine peptidase [Pyrinomonadaceae bacterium]|jgi:hypothetical protein
MRHTPHTKEWTVMFYLASDNPLAPSIVSQLKSIKDAGYHPEANVIAHFDPHTRDTPTHVFDVNLVAKFKARGGSRVGYAGNPLVRNLVLDKLWGDATDEDKNIREQIRRQVKDSLTPKSVSPSLNGHSNNGHGAAAHGATSPGGAAAAEVAAAEVQEVEFEPPVLPEELRGERHPARSLKAFLNFCKNEYPARRYILFLLGHGLVVGNKMFLFDENAGAPALADSAADDASKGDANAPGEVKGADDSPQSLTLQELSDVLGEVFGHAEDGRSQLELIGFHSCSMSGLEVAYQLRGKANYMLASQGLAFVGSWPYKQMLLRLFNDLNAPLREADLTDKTALLSRLKAGADPVSKYLRGKFSDSAKSLLDLHDGSRAPAAATVKAVVDALNAALNDGGLFADEGVRAVGKSEPTRQLMTRGKYLRGANRRRLNRLLLADAYPGAVAPNPVTDDAYVKGLLTKVFDYVLHNNYDFQLAGYSFDLCLFDLSKVSGLTEPIDELAEALKQGLDGGRGLAGDVEPLARELILLAHWDAQSFWGESYTDLYDFCFRLKRRCEHVFPGLKQPAGVAGESAVMRRIVEACAWVLRELERDSGAGEGGGRAVVRAESVGAEYQYSHGLSVYFPWSKPSDGFFEKYKDYEFALKTRWDEFLGAYFTKTMRESRGQEDGTPLRAGQENAVLESLLVTVGARAFPDGHLANKGGGSDATGGKGGGSDASGDECMCPSVKNHPRFTGREPAAEQEPEKERAYVF